MTGSIGNLPPRAVTALHEASEIVRLFPDLPDLRCHEVARAVGHLLDLRVVDGRYDAVVHSWLELPLREGDPPGNPFAWVLDVYAVGRWPQVQVCDQNALTLKRSFWPGERRTDIQEGVVWDLVRSVRRSRRGWVRATQYLGLGGIWAPP